MLNIAKILFMDHKEKNTNENQSKVYKINCDNK